MGRVLMTMFLKALIINSLMLENNVNRKSPFIDRFASDTITKFCAITSILKKKPNDQF